MHMFDFDGPQRQHYGRTGRCRAAKTHGKGPNTLGKAFAERACTAKIARQ
jgi:hypothetical protein